MKIAIVGSGISGLGAAYLLHPHHDITVFEKNDYIGGHSRTIDINIGDKTQPVDTGFIVFNNRNYPHLLGLFELLGVPFEKSNMSFGVSINDGWLEYNSDNLFAQKRNYLRFGFLGMLLDVLRFNKEAMDYLEVEPEMPLEEALDKMFMHEWFRKYYLLPMGASIWSCPVSQIMEFPARTYLRFFNNHGLLTINNRPQWYTVTGGSCEYIKRITEGFIDRIKLNCSVEQVEQKGDTYQLTDSNGQAHEFDQVIFASHADQTLSMISDATELEKDILGAFRYQDNKIIVHSDDSFMPKNKKCWSSWVYLSERREDYKECVSLSYWMNNLQNFKTDEPIIVTLNPGKRPQDHKIYDEHHFSHPIFDVKAIKAQERLFEIQGRRGLWFCGAYQRYGFHEDGLLSAVNIVKAMGYDIPWEKM